MRLKLNILLGKVSTTLELQSYDDIEKIVEGAVKLHHPWVRSADDILALINVKARKVLPIRGRIIDNVTANGEIILVVTRMEWAVYSEGSLKVSSPSHHGKKIIPKHPLALSTRGLSDLIDAFRDGLDFSGMKGIKSSNSSPSDRQYVTPTRSNHTRQQGKKCCFY